MPDTAYFKATRLDGLSFHAPHIDYGAALLSGEVVRHPVARKERDYPETYLSVSIAPADCTGMSWPCRLFRVEPVGRVIGAGKVPLQASPNKRAVSALRVVEELPAWQALGPHGQEVAALIERARRLTTGEATRLAAARDAARDAAWGAAWDAARGAALGAAWDAAWDATRGAARGAAWGAAWDAATALVARDLVSQELFDALYGPWRAVIGDA